MVRGGGARAARRRGGGADRYRRVRGNVERHAGKAAAPGASISRSSAAATVSPRGGVSVGTDQGDYTAKFKELSFDGQNMKARYEFPLDARPTSRSPARSTAAAAEGTWSLVARRRRPGRSPAERGRSRRNSSHSNTYTEPLSRRGIVGAVAVHAARIAIFEWGSRRRVSTSTAPPSCVRTCH